MAASSFSARSSNLRTRRTSGAVAQDHASVSILHVNHPASAAPTAAGGVPASQYGVEKAGATQRNAKKSQDLFTSFSAWAEQFERWQTKPLMRRVMYAVQLGTAFICIFIMLFLRQLPYLALFLGQFVVTGAILLYHTLEAFNAVRKCPLVLAKATIAHLALSFLVTAGAACVFIVLQNFSYTFLIICCTQTLQDCASDISGCDDAGWNEYQRLISTTWIFASFTLVQAFSHQCDVTILLKWRADGVFKAPASQPVARTAGAGGQALTAAAAAAAAEADGKGKARREGTSTSLSLVAGGAAAPTPAGAAGGVGGGTSVWALLK